MLDHSTCRHILEATVIQFGAKRSATQVHGLLRTVLVQQATIRPAIIRLLVTVVNFCRTKRKFSVFCSGR